MEFPSVLVFKCVWEVGREPTDCTSSLCEPGSKYRCGAPYSCLSTGISSVSHLQVFIWSHTEINAVCVGVQSCTCTYNETFNEIHEVLLQSHLTMFLYILSCMFSSRIPAAESFSELGWTALCTHVPPSPQEENLLLCHFLTAFILKTKSCEPSACKLLLSLKFLELKLGSEGNLHTLWVCLFACFIKIPGAFPIRQPLTGESFSGTEILHILGLGFESLLSDSERTQI